MALIEKVLRRLGFSLTHSQEGEDLVLARLFSGRKSGVYLDVGGHHPWRYSNTALLYSRGWDGIVVEPNPLMWRWYRILRPRDRLVRCAAGPATGSGAYHQFRESALNTLDEAIAASRVALGYALRRIDPLSIRTLDDILSSADFRGTLDLVSIDVEGYEEGVLGGFDIPRWKPEVVCVERIGVEIGGQREDAVLSGLIDQGYRPFAKLLHSWILIRKDSGLWPQA